MAATRPKIRTDLAVVELEGEAVVYDPVANELFQLNPTATVVFNLLDGTETMKDIAAAISEAVGVPEDEVERQVRALQSDFRKRGMIQ